MMAVAQPRSERPIEPASAVGSSALAEPFDVRLRFGAAAEASRYLRALASLLFGPRTKVIATLTTGASREDLTAEEIANRLSLGAIAKLRFALRLGERPLTVEFELLASEPGAVAVRTPFMSGPATSRLWLQSDADIVAPIPALALPTTTEGLALDAAHALVGLAVRSGGFREADLAGEHPLAWSTMRPNDAAHPVRSTLRDAAWGTASEAEGAIVAWVSGLLPPPMPRTPEAGWWEQYDVLTRRPREALTELHAHLTTQFDIPVAWTIVDITAAPEGTFVVPPEASAIARLVPEADRVVAVVDLEQPASLVAEMLLHLCAHLTLGHVRPGDTWGHWETATSLSPTPHRQWDREARAYVDATFTRPVRRVSSLEDCNPREKAWLVLLDHIGRMVGQTPWPRGRGLEKGLPLLKITRCEATTATHRGATYIFALDTEQMLIFWHPNEGRP
jgi:hypothetical protein